MPRSAIVVQIGYAWCSTCKTEKPISNFWKERRRWNGLHSTCIPCASAHTKEWIKNHPDHQRNWLLKKYGLTLQDYNNLLEKQKGVCAICGLPQNGRELFVDHDHDTGKVRGLLCSLCNQFLGRIKDNPTKLVQYLQGEVVYNRVNELATAAH